MGCENEELETMTTCLYLILICCQPFLPNLQCFQSCVSWTPFCIFSCNVSHAVVSVTYPWVAVSEAWPKMLTKVGWIWWRHQRALFLFLPRVPPTLNTSLVASFLYNLKCELGNVEPPQKPFVTESWHVRKHLSREWDQCLLWSHIQLIVSVTRHCTFLRTWQQPGKGHGLCE